MPPKKAVSTAKRGKKDEEEEKKTRGSRKKAANTEEIEKSTEETDTKAKRTKKADKEIEQTNGEEAAELNEAKKVRKRKVPAKANKSESDEEEAPKAKVTKRTKAKKSELDEEEPKPKVARKNRSQKNESDEEEAPKPEVTKRTKAKKTELDEEEPKPKVARKNRSKKNESDEEDDPKPKAAKKTKLNATETQWDTLNFTCKTKNSKGKSPNFHIISWNINGLRAWLEKGGLGIVEHAKPDILCLQETKCSPEKLPDEVKSLQGYETFWCSGDKEGYAGVGIATTVKPINVTYGINSEEHDSEGRCITLEYDTFFLINVYVPNAGRKLVTLPKRLDWNELFKAHVKKLDEIKPVIICGDMNVAHEEIDLANPKTNKKNAGFTPEERDGMTEFLQDGYVDSFRQLYPEKEKAYTFWTYMANARAKNVGWRIDYFLLSTRFMERVCDNVIHSDVLGSDHCPVSLHIGI